MTDPTTDSLVTAVGLEANKRGLNLPIEQVVELVRGLMAALAGKLDEAAKAHAAAAGEAAAAGVDTEDEAELAQRKR